MQHRFKVSTGLKNLIGHELITDDFVAVFELVKNSYDAHASSVLLHFTEDKLVIVDDGKGMSRADILSKWLFCCVFGEAGRHRGSGLSASARPSHTVCRSQGRRPLLLRQSGQAAGPQLPGR